MSCWGRACKDMTVRRNGGRSSTWLMRDEYTPCLVASHGAVSWLWTVTSEN
jgi:hypothetical protein